MTPRQRDTLEFVAKIAAVFLPLGIAWQALKNDVAHKTEQRDFDVHVVQEAARNDSLTTNLNGIAASLCVGEKNAYRRVLLHCDARGIK